MEFDKRILLDNVIKILEEEIFRLSESHRANKELSVEAPGRMQSRYDTMGIEAAWLADGLAKNIDNKRNECSLLKGISSIPASTGVVNIFSIVELKDMEKNQKFFYFVLPVSGGLKFSYENILLQTISKDAPLTKSIIGKKKGDLIEVNGRLYVIEDIY